MTPQEAIACHLTESGWQLVEKVSMYGSTRSYHKKEIGNHTYVVYIWIHQLGISTQTDENAITTQYFNYSDPEIFTVLDQIDT